MKHHGKKSETMFISPIAFKFFLTQWVECLYIKEKIQIQLLVLDIFLLYSYLIIQLSTEFSETDVVEKKIV